MLIKQAVLKQIAAGDISLAFRRWRRPSVTSGGTLRTSCGVLAIDAVEPTRLASLCERDAAQAGFASLSDLLADVKSQRPGQLYRIQLRLADPDPRIALRQRSRFNSSEMSEIIVRLARLDQLGRHGPWTGTVLRAIDVSPGTKAADLAAATGFAKEWLKMNVRKLKELGLTESLSPGYRLSPRGKVVLKRLRKTASGPGRK